MIVFTFIWIEVNDYSFQTRSDIYADITSHKLTDNWNCINLRMLLYIFSFTFLSLLLF